MVNLADFRGKPGSEPILTGISALSRERCGASSIGRKIPWRPDKRADDPRSGGAYALVEAAVRVSFVRSAGWIAG